MGGYHAQGRTERATSKRMRGAFERCELKLERERPEVLREGTVSSRRTWTRDLSDHRKEQGWKSTHGREKGDFAGPEKSLLQHHMVCEQGPGLQGDAAGRVLKRLAAVVDYAHHR